MSAPRVGLRVGVRGVGLLGPGLTNWAAGADVLRCTAPYIAANTVLPPPERLPPAERRRSGACVKLAMAVADQAVALAGLDPSTLATVFTSSSGEGSNCHVLCETLATAQPLVSPIRFTNSVHNAASGCWHIAVASRASSTSLCAFDGSFGAGLIEAATSVVVQGQPVLLVASDSPYPEPLHSTRPLPDHLGLSLLLVPASDPQSLAWLTIELSAFGSAASQDLSRCDEPSLDALRRAVPAAAGLPLLQALARGGTSALDVVIDYLPALHLNITVSHQP
jgi:Beta-ketoacyl synthase, N-terminal domain